MRIRCRRFVLTGLFVLSLALVSHGQEAGDGGGGQPDAANFGGFFGDEQEADPAQVELLKSQIDELNRVAAGKAAQGDLNGALTSYQEAISTSPNFNSYLEAARLYVQLEEIPDAIQYFGGAIQMSGSLEGQDEEVLAAFLEMGQAYLDTEQYNQAISAFSTALRLPNQSRNPVILYNVGLAQTEYALNQEYPTAQATQEQLQQALTYFDKAIRIDPNYADALYERGNTHVLLNDADKAIEDLQLATQNDPSNTDAIAQLGFVSLQRGLGEANQRNGQTAKILQDLDLSIRTLTQYLQVVPADAEVDEEDPDAIRRENVLLNRSAAYIGLGDEQEGAGNDHYRQAIADAEAALEIDEEKPDAYYQKGMALRMLGDTNAAMEAYTEAVELAPGQPEYLFRRAVSFFRLGDFELAKSDLEKSVRYSGGVNPRALFWLGLCHQKEDKPNRAIDAYSRAIRYSPQYETAYLNRGLAYMTVGRFERAMTDFNEVLQMDPKNPEARSLRDQAHQLTSEENRSYR